MLLDKGGERGNRTGRQSVVQYWTEITLESVPVERMILRWQANDLLLVLVPGRHDHRVILARQWPSVEVAVDFPSRESGDA